ncbi:hypothetical protein CRE_09133 [Caenorhabditis remanei]|uniref:Serpentine Receptor, class Z n=1 Tax=Caenorhabditis remanei TaxID=31234 RepID=E3LJH8_CAERE|nr:hypothetical protein CRE_09133 [Caenorhabditis remanei]
MDHYHFALKFIFLFGVVMTVYHFHLSVVSFAESNRDDDEDEELGVFGVIKEVVFIISYYANQFILHIFTRVHCLLISIVSLQRFTIYFFPVTEPYVNLNKKNMGFLIKLIYIVSSIFVLHFMFADFLQIVPDSIQEGNMKVSRYIYFYFSLDALYFISSILYLPIMISIRKHSHLASVMENQPQKYVLYQCLICLLFRTVHYPLMLYLYYILDYRIEPLIEFALEMDFLNTPIIVQLAYLFSNKRNAQTLFSKKLLKIMFCLNLNQVDPEPRIEVYSTAVGNPNNANNI